jgi:hypothetical protein
MKHLVYQYLLVVLRLQWYNILFNGIPSNHEKLFLLCLKYLHLTNAVIVQLLPLSDHFFDLV